MAGPLHNGLFCKDSRVTRSRLPELQRARVATWMSRCSGAGATNCRAFMQNMLVVNAEGPETRVAVVEEGALAEFFVERKRDRGMVGNIYRGKVTRVLPGMQAAFVDLGPKVERAAFLYVADVLGSGDEKRLFEDAEVDEDSETGRSSHSRKQLAQRKIEDLLKPGNDVLVQVTKDPIGL